MTRRKMGAACTALAFLAVSGLATAPAVANHVFYTVTDLGTLGGSETFARGINNSGQVVGESQQNSTNESTFRAFRTTAPNGRINPATDATDNLRTLGGPTSQASGINASGQVVGSSTFDPGPAPPPFPPPTGANPATRAFRTTAGGVINAASDLGTLGGENSAANAINASGQVVGFAETAGEQLRAFRTTAGGVINAASDLGTLGGEDSVATGINASGQVVGSAETASGALRAFRTTAGGVINAASDLGTLGGANSEAFGINDSGQVVGSSRRADGQLRAFRTTAGGMINAASDLGTLGGTFSQAFAINSFGSVVGTSGTANPLEARAFLVEAAGMVDLNSLIFGSRNFILTDARGINDLGQIIAFGRDADGFTRSVLLTAVPEPGSATLAVSGVLILLGYGLRRRKGSV